MAKTDYIRSPESNQRIVEHDLKVAGALFMPVFEEVPSFGGNIPEAGAIAMYAGDVGYYDGENWIKLLVGDSDVFAKKDGGNQWTGDNDSSGYWAARNFITSSYAGALTAGDISGGNFKASSINNASFVGLTTYSNSIPEWQIGRSSGGDFVLNKWNGSSWVNSFNASESGVAVNGVLTVNTQQNITAGAYLNYRYGTGYVQGDFRQSISGGNLLFNRTGFVTSGGVNEPDNTYSFKADGIYYNNSRVLTSTDELGYAKKGGGNSFTGTQDVYDGAFVSRSTGNPNVSTGIYSSGGFSARNSTETIGINPANQVISWASDATASVLNITKPSDFSTTTGNFTQAFQMKNGTIALLSDVTSATGNYLLLSGGNLTGDVQQPTAPLNGFSLINKSYVDNLITGLTWKTEVRAATTANITLSGTQTIDGIALSANQRVLVKNQSNQSQNGIYIVAAGAWSRALDADTTEEIEGATVMVRLGTVNKDTQWTNTNNNEPVIGTDAITFAQIAGAGTYTNGTGITLTGNVFAFDTSFGDARYKFTTLAGYGITDAYTKSQSDANYVSLSGSYANPNWITSIAWGKITGTPTTIAGYGITDAYSKTEVDNGFVNTTGNQTGILGSKTWSGSQTYTAGFTSNAASTVSRNVADANPAFIVNNAAGTADVFRVNQGGVTKFKVDLNGTTTISGNLLNITDNTQNIGGSTINFQNIYGRNFSSNNVMQFVTTNSNSFAWVTGVTERMRLFGGGRLGIGTTTDNNIDLLQVNGSILATAPTYTSGAISYLIRNVTSGRYESITGDFINITTTAKTAASTLTATDEFILIDTSGGTFATTIPTAVGVSGRRYTLKKIDSSTNPATISFTSGQTVDGVTSYSLAAQFKYLTIVSNGANWLITANN